MIQMVLELIFLSERVPQLSIADLKVKWLSVQPITQHYKQRTVGEVAMQSIQSPWKIPLFATTNRHLF